MLMLFNNLFSLAVLFLVSFCMFKFFLRKNELLSRTIRVFLFLQVLLVVFILCEQHRFGTDLSKSIFIDDGEIYSANGWQISTALTGVIPSMQSIAQMRGIHLADRSWGLERYYNDYIKKKIIAPVTEYHTRYVTYFYALIYAVYGFTPALISFMNVILHLLTAIIIYKSVTLIFDDNRAAYLSMFLFLLNPITFYYSSTKLQESIGMFLMYLSVYCFIMFSKKRKFKYIFFIFFLFYIIFSFVKESYSIPLILVFIFSSLVILFKRNKKTFLILTVLIIFYLVATHNHALGKLKSYIRALLDVSVVHNRGFYNTGGKVYQLFITGKESQDYTFADWLIYVSRGWYHMLSEPIVSSNVSVKLILLYPVKVIFLILCALAIPGILMAFRYGCIESVIFSSILIMMGTGIAMSSGNIGTMLRHRDVITPAIFIFSSFYISRFFNASSIVVRKEQ